MKISNTTELVQVGSHTSLKFKRPKEPKPKRRTFSKGTCEFDVFEVWYSCGIRVTEPAYYALARAYPRNEQRKSVTVTNRYAQGYDLAKNKCFTNYKATVRDFIVPCGKFQRMKEPYDFCYTDFALDAAKRTATWEDRPTFEFRLAMLTQLYYLRETLETYAPLMVPMEDVESLVAVLGSTFESAAADLLLALSRYRVTPRYKESDF